MDPLAMADIDDDILDTELLAKQRRLLMRITQGAKQQTLTAWKNLTAARKSRRIIEEKMAPYKGILETAPFSRSAEDISKLNSLVDNVAFFKSLPHQVRLQTVQQLRVVPLHDCELQSSEKDHRALFIVAAGHVETITDTFFASEHALFHNADAEDSDQKEAKTAENDAAIERTESFLKQESTRSLLVSESQFDDEELSTGEASHDELVHEFEDGVFSVRDMKAKLKNTATTHIQYAVFREGDAFTGRHLDIRLSEKEYSGYAPQKVLAVCTEENCSAVLLKLYQDDLMAAVRHRTEAATLRRIDFCCRIPVLRHSPFKELQQVCTNVTEKLFEPGAVIVQQGKEATHVHIVLEGEVGIFMDLAEKVDKGSASVSYKKLSDKFADLMAKRNVQHALLAMRGPGALLGDDSLRERYMAVMAIAKTPVRTMMITIQKFKLCMDVLTLNRMTHFRHQISPAEQALLKEHIKDSNSRDAYTDSERDKTLQWAVGKDELPTTLLRHPLPVIRPWKPNGGRGGGKSIQSFSGIVDVPKVDPNKQNHRKDQKDKLFEVDMERWGLLAAANTLGLSSPSMGLFLKSVKQQVAQEQLALKMKREAEKRETLGFVFPLANSTANIEKESWIDCRDFIEENVQQQRYTEMMETAVLLVVDLVACPGQGSIDLKKLCRACDEARIKWGASATARGLQLVRWSCTTWYLFSSLGEQGLKHRPVVREVAECALEMEAAWRDVMREHSLLVHSFNAGLVVGSLFASYDGGKFLSSLAGRAFDTARQLAEESRSVGTRGCILAMDAVMEALRHTHDVALEGSNYRLVRAIRLPFDYSMRHLMGSEADTDPVSPGPGRGPGQPAAWNDSHGDGSLNKATLITAGVEQSAAGSSRKLKVEIPSPNQAAGQPVGTPSSHPALIGYGPDALVTPGGYGKPLALKPNFMTQATMAHRHVTTRSFRELKAALSTDMPVTPGGTLVTDWESPQHDESGVLNRSLNAKSFHGQPGAANPRDHSHKKKSKESAKERQPPKPEPSSLSLCKDFASAQTPVANVAHSKRSNLGRLSSSSRLDATSSTAAGVYKPGSSMPNQEPPCEGPLRTLRVHQAVNHKTARSQTIKLSAMKVARQALGSSAVRAAATAHFPQQPKDAIDCILQETVRPERTRSPLSESTRRIGFSNLNVSTASPKSSSSSPVSSKSPVRSHRSMLSPLRATEIGQPNVVEDAAHVEAAAEYHPHYGDLLHGHHKRNIRFEGQGSKDGPPDAEWHFAGRTESDAVQNEGVSGLPIHKTLSLTVDVQVDPNDHFLHEQPSEGSRHLADGDAAPGYRERAGFPSTRRMSARAGERQNELDVLRVSKDCGSMHSAKQYVSSIPSGSMVVVLSLAGLVELPPMGHLLYLEMLAASHNRIVTVPAADMWMGLSRLQNLVLAHNQIAALPPDMFRAMHNLKELNLASNCLQEIPRSLWSVKSLRVLCLTGNKLQHLPPQVSELVSLEQLHCGRNEITSIPIQLASLASLSVLDMGYNKLDNVPGDLAKLTSLRKLSLSGNQLTALPVEMMSSLRCLEHLQLAGNAFREIWSEETANLIVEPLEDFTGLPSDYVQEEQPPGGSIEPTPRDWQGSVHSMLTEETDDSRDEKHSILELIQLLTPRTAMLGMAEASSDFIAFPSLKALDLSNNKLKVIPEWVPPGVEELLLSFNRLVEIPEWLPLRLRVSLKLIDVHHNSIVDLPKGMRLLRNVELMALRDNPLVAPGSGPIAEAFSRGCTATQIVDILKKKPLRKLRLAATLVSRTIGQTMALRNYLADQKCGQKTETGN